MTSYSINLIKVIAIFLLGMYRIPIFEIWPEQIVFEVTLVQDMYLSSFLARVSRLLKLCTVDQLLMTAAMSTDDF